MIVGVLGAGQLARMIALAGYPLGVKFVFLDPSADACANSLGEHLLGAYDDPRLLAELAERSDIVTYEFENVPAHVAEFLASHTQVHPAPKALAVAQDRLIEKTFFNDIYIIIRALPQGISAISDYNKRVEYVNKALSLCRRSARHLGALSKQASWTRGR